MASDFFSNGGGGSTLFGGSGSGDTSKEFGRSTAEATVAGDVYTEAPKITVPDNTLAIALAGGLGALVLVIALVFLKR